MTLPSQLPGIKRIANALGVDPSCAAIRVGMHLMKALLKDGCRSDVLADLVAASRE